MGRLTNSKKEKLVRIETARYILGKHLENGLITIEDIMALACKNANYGLKISDKKYSYKASVLKDIFNCPFLLCDQENLSIEIKKLLPIFLNTRYQIEKDMLDYYYKECYFSKEEYDKEIDELDFVYYKSSNDGKKIQKTGTAVGINSKVKKI